MIEDSKRYWSKIYAIAKKINKQMNNGVEHYIL